MPPWRRFPKPPYIAGWPNFSGPVSSLGHFVDEPSFPFATKLKRWFAYTPSANGLPTASSLSLAPRFGVLGFIKPSPRLS